MQKLLPLGIYITEINTELRKTESSSIHGVFLKDKFKTLHTWKFFKYVLKLIGQRRNQIKMTK